MTTQYQKKATLDYKKYFESAISYTDYQQAFLEELNDEKSPFSKYLPQNWQRQNRLDRKFKLNDKIKEVLGSSPKKRNWLVITEHWCGDASQINPIWNRIAEESEGRIDLRFIYRDDNHELIDAHLTNGKSRSIPILIELNENFQFVKSYGPRPEEAQNLVLELLANGSSYDVPLHTWYAKDKQQSLQHDMLKFLMG